MWTSVTLCLCFILGLPLICVFWLNRSKPIPMQSIIPVEDRKTKRYIQQCVNQLVCVIEHPKDVRNLAAVIRSVHCLGLGGLYVVDSHRIVPRDVTSDRVFHKLSASASKWTPIVTFQNSKDCMAFLQKQNFINIATTPYLHTKTARKHVMLDQFTWNDPSKKIAVWFGNEMNGISSEVLEACDQTMQIETFGVVESLNLAASVAIISYKLMMQYRSIPCHSQKR